MAQSSCLIIVKNFGDGSKIRLFSPHNGRIYVGLLPYIKEFCLRNSIEYIIEKGVEDDRNVIREIRQRFCRLVTTLEVEANLYNSVIIKLMQSSMNYTKKSLSFVMSYCFKSLIIYTLVRYYHLMNLKTLILVPTTSLVEQMYSDFIDYGWRDGTSIEFIRTMIGSVKPVVISTWQSLYKLHRPYFAQYTVSGDEISFIQK